MKVLNEHGVGLSECCALIAIMTQLKITFEIQNQSPQKLGPVANHFEKHLLSMTNDQLFHI